jgi:hypothetical protein
VLNIRAAKWVFYSLKKVLFSNMMNCKIYIVLQIWTNCMLNISVLDDLSTFEYLEIMMMLKYVYDIWSLNKWCDSRIWMGIFVDYDCIVNDWVFSVSYKGGDMMHCVLNCTVLSWRLYDNVGDDPMLKEVMIQC